MINKRVLPYRKHFFLYFLLIFGLFPTRVYGILPGIPFISNYTKQDYKAATQSWDIAQDKNGIMYFANNDGLLSYNGQTWQVHALPNLTIARSLEIDSQQRIYVGGQDEFGIFQANDRGTLLFTSLKHLIPEEFRSFEDVWDIELIGQEIFFRTNKRLYYFKGNTCQVYQAEGEFSFLGKAHEQIYTQDNRGLLVFANRRWEVLQNTGNLSKGIISGISSLPKGQMVIHTLKNGSFVYENKKLSVWGASSTRFFQKNWITSSEQLPDGRIAFGTYLGGLILMKQDGSVLNWINKQAGLQHSHVTCLFADRSGGIWAGLNNGIDYIEASSPFSVIYPDGELKDAGYALNIWGNNIYYGTANGLYYSNLDKNPNLFERESFSFVPGTAGEVRGLSIVNEQLFMGHHQGAFLLKDASIYPLSTQTGVWKYLQLDKFPGYMISGNYDGIHLYQQQGNKWKYVKKLEGLDESCRILESDKEGNIWISHPYRGIYQISFPDGPEQMHVQFYNANHGLPQDNFNSVYKIRNKIVIATAQGVYQFQPEIQRFQPHTILNTYLGENTWVKLLLEDKDNNVWFVADEDVGVLKIQEEDLQTKIERMDIPELRDKLFKGHEFLFPYDERNVFFAVEKGFIHFDPGYQMPYDSLLNCMLDQVHMIAGKDSLVFGGFSLEHSGLGNHDAENFPRFSYDENAFRFTFASTQFSQSSKVSFQFYLKGGEAEWNPWTRISSKEYTNLSPGTYEFMLKSKNEKGTISEVTSFPFQILPPWYASQTAYAFYSILAVLIFIGILWIPRIQFKKEKDQLKTIIHQQRAEQDQQISQINHERLQEEVRHKSQELASATMHLVQKNEILTKIRTELENISEKAQEKETKEKISSLTHLIVQDQKMERDWEQFAYHFDQVHRDFLSRLASSFPQLSPTDHRLCAYLRMNLSTKEIAPLMNISIRGVETGRYRLRKKMNLANDVNLSDFMIHF